MRRAAAVDLAVGSHLVAVARIPVPAPLPDVAEHVVKLESVRLLQADFVRLVRRVFGIPGKPVEQQRRRPSTP